jgi:hypothetical protein
MKKLDFQRNYTQYYGLCAIVGVTCLLIWLVFAWPTFAALQNGQSPSWPLPFVTACALLGVAIFFITQQHLKSYLMTVFTNEGVKQCNFWRCKEIFWSDIVRVEIHYEGNDPRLRPLQATFESADRRIYLTLSLFKDPKDLLIQIYNLVPADTMNAYDPSNPTSKVEKALSAPTVWWLCVIGCLAYSAWTTNPVSGVIIVVVIVLRLAGRWNT